MRCLFATLIPVKYYSWHRFFIVSVEVKKGKDSKYIPKKAEITPSKFYENMRVRKESLKTETYSYRNHKGVLITVVWSTLILLRNFAVKPATNDDWKLLRSSDYTETQSLIYVDNNTAGLGVSTAFRLSFPNMAIKN